jgi:hypothetical protein
VLALIAVVAPWAAARAEAPPAADAAWRVRSEGRLTLDAGLSVGLPTALDAGLATGVAAGAMFGRRFAWGARASWSTATESSLSWQVTQSDLKLRAAAALQQAVGRGRFGLRLGLGPTVVHETRLRNQGMRAGLTGSALSSSAFATMAAGELEAVVDLHIAGPWLLTISGGPSLAIVDGAARGGWVGFVGAGWQP